jgi:hypothetical protein
VIGTVARRAVAVDVSAVAWQEAIQRRDKVRIGPSAKLDDDQSGRGVGREDTEQPVAFSGHEFGAGFGQVEQAAAPRGLDHEFGRLHE